MLYFCKKIVPLSIGGFSKFKAGPMGRMKANITEQSLLTQKKKNLNINNKIRPAVSQFASPFQKKVSTVTEVEEPIHFSKKHAVITIMGHVDHGKTTLIDFLRSSDIALKEDGGITQKIGAFRIELDGERITFIDTPGHQAFTNMRKRGATMTDLVVLMISAIEGVKKQTHEVIQLIKEMQIPVIVAINKIDLPQANPQEIEKQIQAAGLDIEPLGGQIPVVHISAKTGFNVDLLCELIKEETKDLEAVFNGLMEGCVLEANQTKDGLNSMTIIVDKGILKTNTQIVLGKQSFKIKTILGDRGEVLKEVYPGEAVQIIGIPHIPSPGDAVFEVKDQAKAKLILDQKKLEELKNNKEIQKQKQKGLKMKASLNFDRTREGRRERRAFFKGVQEVWVRKFNEQEEKLENAIQQLKQKQPNPLIEESIIELELKLIAHKEYVFEYLKNTGNSPDTLNFMMKFGDRGMEETVMLQLEKLKKTIENETKVKLNLIKSDVGEVTIGDIEEADNCSAKIFTFGAGVSSDVKANLNGREAPRTHKLIHNFLKDLKQTSFNKKLTSIRGIQRGRGSIAQIYKLKIKKSDQFTVPGIKVTSGKISKQHKCYIFRNSIPISQPFTINFLKSFKKQMIELKRGDQGTIGFLEEIQNVEKGDQIVSFEQ